MYIHIYTYTYTNAILRMHSKSLLRVHWPQGIFVLYLFILFLFFFYSFFLSLQTLSISPFLAYSVSKLLSASGPQSVSVIVYIGNT